jgi:beta-1,4-N-acetylglucosaminyltransferase
MTTVWFCRSGVMGKSAFVTVGTTQFDLLIETILRDDSDVLRTLIDCLHIEKLIIQTGSSQIPPSASRIDLPIVIEHYKYKDSIDDDIQQADLVISHAGAGTILQTLEAHKPLLVVVNEQLMDNHQVEIADEMERQGYLFHCTCASLAVTLKKFDRHTFQQYEQGNPSLFGRYLNQIMF